MRFSRRSSMVSSSSTSMFLSICASFLAVELLIINFPFVLHIVQALGMKARGLLLSLLLQRFYRVHRGGNDRESSSNGPEVVVNEKTGS